LNVGDGGETITCDFGRYAMSATDERVYLAFDLGASSGRGVLGAIGDDGRITLEEVNRFPNGPVDRDDGAFWEIDRLFECMLEAMRIVADRGIAPASIGVDTWGVDFGLLDASGELLKAPRAYRDRRNVGVCERIVEIVGAQRLQDRTGSTHQDHDSLCQLLAMKEYEPELLAGAETLLFIPDLLRYWLCGAKSTDVTFPSTGLLYDVPGREWATDILDELHLPTHILPDVHIGPTVVGALSEAIQAGTGLGPVPVVAGGGHDTGAAFGTCLPAIGGSACGADELPDIDDLTVISTGTWAILGVFVDGHLPGGTLDPRLFGYEANPDGGLRIVCNRTGGWLLEQCRRQWAEQGIELDYAELIADAKAAAGSEKASAIVDPDWDGFYNPDDMAGAIVDRCGQTDQPAPESPGEFAQVIFASLADNYARTVELLREKTGRKLTSILMMGGMARNAYLNDLTADRAGVDVIVGPAEATAMGNVAVQMAALRE